MMLSKISHWDTPTLWFQLQILKSGKSNDFLRDKYICGKKKKEKERKSENEVTQNAG